MTTPHPPAKYEVKEEPGTRHMHSSHMRSVTNKNISFKNIRVGRGCLLSPPYSNSEDKDKYCNLHKS